jgi:HlyD family secretion protein
MVHIATWTSSDALRVPIAALFRRGADWNVFRLVDGKAVATRVAIGHRNGSFAEVTQGLNPGDRVILHPSDRVSAGVAVEPRAN